MSIVFPKEDENRIKGDPLAWVKKVASIHGYEGKKKYIWPPAAFMKGVILVCRTIYAIQNIHEPKRVVELIATYPIRFMAVCKMFYCYYDKRRIDYFYQTIANEFWDFRVAGPKVESQLKTRFFYANLMLKSYCINSVICLVVVVFFPLVEMPEGMRLLPNIIWIPFDTNPSPLHEIVFVILLWNLILSPLGNIFYDFVFVYGIQHLIAQLMLLKGLLKNIDDGIMEDTSDDEKFNSNYFQETIMYRLKICVNHHCKLLKFGKHLELYSSKILAPQLLMNYATLVINGFMLSVDNSQLSRDVILSSISVSAVVFIEVALYAIQISDMNFQSLAVINAIYESKWYLFKAPLKRALTLIMLNAEAGLVVRAGGMVNVDKPMLVSLMQKAFSAITLLKALID